MVTQGCCSGAGRIPAGLNGCVGLKGTVGRVSTTGVVPACASLDCLTCFAATVRDAASVMQIMQVLTYHIVAMIDTSVASVL